MKGGELAAAEEASGSVLLMAINSNGLAFFLLCNVLVGVVKVSHAWLHGGMPTWQNGSAAEGVAWVLGYGLVACGVAWLAHRAGIQVNAALFIGRGGKAKGS